MDLPAEVLVHNALLGIKGSAGTLLRIAEEGYYEVRLKFGEREHRVLLPIGETVVIQRAPEETVAVDETIER